MLPSIVVGEGERLNQIAQIQFDNKKLLEEKEKKIKQKMFESFSPFSDYIISFIENCPKEKTIQINPSTSLIICIIRTYSNKTIFSFDIKIGNVDAHIVYHLSTYIDFLAKTREASNIYETYDYKYNERLLNIDIITTNKIRNLLKTKLLENRNKIFMLRDEVTDVVRYSSPDNETIEQKREYNVTHYKFSPYFQQIIDVIKLAEEILIEEEYNQNAEIKANMEIEEQFPELRV